eukprot:1191446-Prorocentrum_minimum.AAC.2
MAPALHRGPRGRVLERAAERGVHVLFPQPVDVPSHRKHALLLVPEGPANSVCVLSRPVSSARILSVQLASCPVSSHLVGSTHILSVQFASCKLSSHPVGSAHIPSVQLTSCPFSSRPESSAHILRARRKLISKVHPCRGGRAYECRAGGELFPFTLQSTMFARAAEPRTPPEARRTICRGSLNRLPGFPDSFAGGFDFRGVAPDTCRGTFAYSIRTRLGACPRANVGPIRRSKRGYILTTDQSDAGSAGIFSQRTDRTHYVRVSSHCGPKRSSPPSRALFRLSASSTGQTGGAHQHWSNSGCIIVCMRLVFTRKYGPMSCPLNQLMNVTPLSTPETPAKHPVNTVNR